MHEIPERNMGFGLVRVTEEAAVAAGRWMGLGNRKEADRSAVNAMLSALETIDMDGVIVIGEDGGVEPIGIKAQDFSDVFPGVKNSLFFTTTAFYRFRYCFYT